MADFISREAVLACKGDCYDHAGHLLYAVGTGDILRIPAADVVERKPGVWIWDDEGYHCSECFYHAYGSTVEILSGVYHFCPHCGATMRKDTT